jgi:tetratricopeptide (TPR) repeat protein
MTNPDRRCRLGWVRFAGLIVLLVGALVFASTSAGAGQKSSLSQAREIPPVPCRGGNALLALGRVKAAEAAFEEALSTGTTVRCAREGLAKIGREYSCATAKALLQSGEKAEANKAYLESLAAKPAGKCAVTGVEESSDPSFLDRIKSFGEDVLAVFGAFLLGLAILAVALLVLIRIQSLLPWFKDRWPAGRIREATVTVENLDDSAFEPKLGVGTAALMRRWIEADSRHRYLKLVSGASATEETWLSKVAEAGDQGKFAAAVIGIVMALLPRRHVKVTGELQPATAASGPGVSVELHRKLASRGNGVLWAEQFLLPVDTKVAADTVRKLVVPTSAWVSHRVTSETGGKALAAREPMSWALFKAGVEWQRGIEVEKAAELYRAALNMDEANYGARANLALLCARKGKYKRAIDLLTQARQILEAKRMGDHLANPDWYRVSYSLVAERTNWAFNGNPKARRERLEWASKGAEMLQATVTQALGRRMWGLKAMRKERRELLSFLRDQFEPSLEVLAAGIQLSKSELGSSKTREVKLVRAMVAAFAADKDYVADVEYNLACLYAQTHMPRTSKRHLEKAFAKTDRCDQLLLVWRVSHDSTLKAVRKGFLRSHPGEAEALRLAEEGVPRQRPWI